MAHRFNCITNRKEPKQNASERTLYPWRERNGIQTDYDKMRSEQREETKIKVQERMKQKLSNIAAGQALMNIGTALLAQARGKK